jgi:hypothetical protein
MHCLWNCVDFAGNRKRNELLVLKLQKRKLTFGGSALFPKSLYVTQQ